MVFALDVGTRKVAGILANLEGENVIVYDLEVLEHERRAMLDGQVHDVEKVAKTVDMVKRRLEERNEVEFESVAIALAGRYLETVTGSAEVQLSGREIDSRTVLELEISAVKNAVEKLGNQEMYCTGYSVLRYELDGSWMMKLEGHRGKRAFVEVIAAFLPAQVVDSMTSVVRSVGLEIDHMTLEPIAAMDLVVPEELRLLNIALVDVGAGTSDIAISREGTVVAYGMVPKAGDEITEAIAQEYLLDFDTAEVIKRSLSDGFDSLVVKDVLDQEKTLSSSEVMEVIDPVVEDITREIADTILKLNSEPPKAVMVVGGGAKVPGFVEKLRSHLNLPRDRVRLKSVESLKYVVDRTGRLHGSEMITPVGIAKSALLGRGGAFSQINVNGVPVRMIGLGGRYTVMQVLLQAGYDIGKLLGGSTIVYEVNGRVRHVRSQSSPVIKVNGKPAGVRTTITHGDTVEVLPPESSHIPRIRDVVEPVRVILNGERIEVYPRIRVNGAVVDIDRAIEDGDRIEHDPWMSVSDILKELSLDIVVNGREMRLELPVELLRDGKPLKPDDRVKMGEVLNARVVSRPRVRDVLDIPKIRVKFNGEVVEVPAASVDILSDGKRLSLDSELEKGMNINVDIKRFKPIVATLLSVVELDTTRFKRYKILKNGTEASFADPISDGDEIEFIEEG